MNPVRLWKPIGILVCLVLLFAFVTETSAQGPSVRIIIFYSSRGCPDCLGIVQDALTNVSKTYPNQVEAILLDTTIAANQSAFMRLREQRYVSALELPQAFVGDMVIVGTSRFQDRLDKAISSKISSGGAEYSFTDTSTRTPTSGFDATTMILVFSFTGAMLLLILVLFIHMIISEKQLKELRDKYLILQREYNDVLASKLIDEKELDQLRHENKQLERKIADMSDPIRQSRGNANNPSLL